MNAPNQDNELDVEPAAKAIEPQERTPLGESKPTNSTEDTPSEPVIDAPTPTQPSEEPPPEVSAADSNEPAKPEISVPEFQQFDRIVIRLSFIDPLGAPIKDLDYRVLVGGKTHEGKTDAAGLAAKIEDVRPYLSLEILIKRDDGNWSSKYKGETICTDMNICAQSPSLKLAVTTEEHKGAPQKPPQPKPAPPAPATPKPPLPLAGQVSKPAPEPEVKSQPTRNEQGHPVIRFGAALDWATRILPIVSSANLYIRYKTWRKEQDIAAGAGNANAKVATHTENKQKTTSGNSNTTPAINKSAITSLTQTPPLAVTQLVAIMEEQCTWQWKPMYEKGLNSGSILSGLQNKTLEPDSDKEATKSHGRCYPSVKVGLMRANLASKIWDDIPAKGAGAWLKDQGFKEITKDIPDARWAAPGDIIVYRYDDETERENTKKHQAAFDKYEAEKKAYPAKLKAWELAQKEWAEQQKKTAEETALAAKTKGKPAAKPKQTKAPSKPIEPKIPDAENWGHIDVRTYDGYISDFKTRTLPFENNPNGRKGFVVTGVYRKIYDPLPEIRVRAFLKILREWENFGISDDSKRYFAIYKTGKEQKYFTDTSRHPNEVMKADNTPAGAYQITLPTYFDLIKPENGTPAGFSPDQQDRLAVIRIEYAAYNDLGIKRGDALSLIRKGEIGNAIRALNRVWSSLPNGKHQRKKSDGTLFTEDDVIKRHKEFMEEIARK